jgi:hypothetical protein
MYVYGCTGMYGCMGVRVYGCTGVLVYRCTMGVRVYGDLKQLFFKAAYLGSSE